LSVLVCENIYKIHKKKTIIEDFSYNFLENKTYALIGRYDGFQEELLNLLSNKSKPTKGKIYLDGEIISSNSKICYLANDTTFPAHLTVMQIFKLMHSFFPNWDTYYAYELSQYFDIGNKDRFFNLSKGKKSILIGILSLATRASITILNKPLEDADLKQRYDFFEFLYKHNEKNPRTFIINTTNIDEIDFLVDRLLLIDSGILIDTFRIKDMKNNFRYLSGKAEVLKSLIGGVKVIGVEERGNQLTVCVRHKLKKDEIRKYQKYLINITEVPIQKIIIYLMNLREIKEIE